MSTERAPLEKHLPPVGDVNDETLLEGFLAYVEEVGLSLYPAQEEAILEIFANKSVVLNTPTGSGKSLVALAMHFKALAEGGRAYYTAPIKALVSEKFFELCRVFGAANVGMATGDATVNRDAPIVCCTAEILSNLALREGPRADVDYVVMDEFHYYSDRDRGSAWQIPLLELPKARFLLMSATLGETHWLVDSLASLTKDEVALVRSLDRPVPLDFEYRETPIDETIRELFASSRVPVYVVHFSQRSASDRAQDLMSIDFLSKEQKQSIKDELRGFRFDTPFGKELKRWVHHGVGVHHAGMLPKYRLMVEKLAQKGLLKIICGTDTLGVGVNVPIRTVLFTQLFKFDGDKTKILTVRDFKQIAGRAGRRGFDVRGTVVCQAPEHAVENKLAQMKALGDPKKMKKLVAKKPPEKGYAHFDEGTFARLEASEPEKLVSRFDVTHGMLLHVLSRGGKEGCFAMRNLVKRSHESKVQKQRLLRKAVQIARSLRDAGVITLGADGVRVNEDLQQDFSLNQALSLFVVEAVTTLELEALDYALDVLTVVESTVEDPMPVLVRQVDLRKTRALAAMKAEGLEYEERMAELEKIDYPKPKAELLYGLFDGFRSKHAWVAGGISPKSIARDMYEEGESFLSYVKVYGLARSEGVLLRYLTDVYKALVQSVPEGSKTTEVQDLQDWLFAIVRSVDSSLLDEWEKLRSPEAEKVVRTDEELAAPDDIVADRKAFAILVRNEVWKLVRSLARRDYVTASELLDLKKGEDPWTPARLEDDMRAYFEEHGELRVDPMARAPKHCAVEPHESFWRVKQTILDPNEYGEWVLDLDVDVERSREEGRPVLLLGYVGP